MSGGSMDSSPSSSPGSQSATTITIPNGAPKFGTLVPNRVFVGGISSTTTESELHQLFSAFGNVKQTKIIQDRAGVSKGYGFVTFETEEEARRLQVEADNIMLKERKLNIAPAIKKQQTYCSRSYEMGQPVLNGGYYYSPSGTPYTYQNGVAMFTSDTGQHALGLLQQIPAKGGAGAHSGSPFPLIYGPAGHAAMFLPNGHTAAQAAAVASVTQQQLQLQTAAATAAHINGVAAAQSQSPTRDGTSGRDGTTNSTVGTNQGWRWTALANGGGNTTASANPGSVTNCGATQQAAVQAATLHGSVGQLAQSNAANQQIATQGINYAQDVYSFQGGNTAGGFLHPLETFHYIPSVFSTGLHHPGFVIPDRQTNY